MDVKELTDAMNAFVTAMGWYEPESPFAQTPRNIAISLSLEAAEVLEQFQWQSEALAEEIVISAGLMDRTEAPWGYMFQRP